MSTSYPAHVGLRRPFIVTPYSPAAGGQMCPSIPDRCPTGATSDPAACDVRIDYFRPRKTGPGFALSVCRCLAHPGDFTLYPPGYRPYARQPLLSVAPDGASPVPEASSTTDRLAEYFRSTPFEAALDAEQSRSWARDPDVHGTSTCDRWWSTQCRHLSVARHVLALTSGVQQVVRATIASVLSIDILTLTEGARAQGYVEIGRSICRVLSDIKGGARRAMQLLVCGYVTGRWGEPLCWDRKRKTLERTPFSVPEPTGSG